MNIKSALGHKLIGNKFMQKMVIASLRDLPDKITHFVAKNTWFVSSFTDGWAFTLRHEDLKPGEFLIFLSDELLSQSEDQIKYTILHEVGHIILGHRNSIAKIQTKAEVRKQEKEADEFALRFLRRSGL